MPDSLSALGRAALALAARRRPVFPCRPDKRPYTSTGFKEASTEAAAIEGWWRRWPAALIGMPTGETSGLVVLDVDQRPTVDGAQSLMELTEAHGQLPDTVEALTPSGGRHVYFRWPGVVVRTTAGKLGPGLDVRGDGGYVIVPPSEAPSGRYEWEGSNPAEGAAAMPPWLLELCQARTREPLRVIDGGKEKRIPAREVQRIRSALAALPAEDYDIWLRVGMALHATGAGQQAFGLWNEWSQLSTKYDPAACSAKWGSFHAEGGTTVATVFALAQQAGWTPAPQGGAERASGGRGDEGASDWRDLLTRTQNGGIRPHEHNVLLVLRHHPALVTTLRHDVLANRLEVHRTAPWASNPRAAGAEAEAWAPWRDSDKTRLAGWLAAPPNAGIHAGAKLVRECAIATAELSPHNPVALYLEQVAAAWDGTARLERLLPDFFGTEASEYTLALGRHWLVSAVARALRPGCEVHFMLILEGGQGIGKTRSVRALASPPWYAEAQESPQHKDFYQSLIGKWMIEIGEMSSFTRAEASVVKQAITRASDYYRASYAETAADHLRACVFVGTTNERRYLRDDTGNRRFYPVACTECQVETLERMRDQLWAEAVHLYRDGWPYWTEPPGAKEEQEARRDADSWEDVIAEWLAGDCGREGAYPAFCDGGYGVPVNRCTVTHILTHALQVDLAKHTRAEQTRVGRAMTALGWLQSRPQVGGLRVRMFERPKR